MEANAIWVVLAALVAFALIFRSASSSPDKTTTGAPEPSPYDQDALEALTKAQLVEVAAELGVEVRMSWTKAKIIQVIIIAVREGTN